MSGFQEVFNADLFGVARSAPGEGGRLVSLLDVLRWLIQCRELPRKQSVGLLLEAHNRREEFAVFMARAGDYAAPVEELEEQVLPFTNLGGDPMLARQRVLMEIEDLGAVHIAKPLDDSCRISHLLMARSQAATAFGYGLPGESISVELPVMAAAPVEPAAGDSQPAHRRGDFDSMRSAVIRLRELEDGRTRVKGARAEVARQFKVSARTLGKWIDRANAMDAEAARRHTSLSVFNLASRAG